jgi:hypothetical protein
MMASALVKVRANKPVCIFGRGSLRSQRDQMFIDPDDPDQLPSSVAAKHLAAEEHISLLWSEAVLFSYGSINISPLRGEDRICV